MDAIRVKARLNRKSRPSDGGRGAKAARPVHPAKAVAGRVPRVVKARAGRPPIPANDTMPLPAEDMGLPVLPDVEIEAVEIVPENAVATAGEEVPEAEASEVALAAADAPEAEADADEEDEEEEEAEAEVEATTKRKPGDD